MALKSKSGAFNIDKVLNESESPETRFKNKHNEVLTGQHQVTAGYYFMNSEYYVKCIKKTTNGWDEFVNNFILWCLNYYFVSECELEYMHIPMILDVDIEDIYIYREYKEGSEGFRYDLNSSFGGIYSMPLLYPKEYKTFDKLLYKAGIAFTDLDDWSGRGTKNIIIDDRRNNQDETNPLWYMIDFDNYNVKIYVKTFFKFIEKNKPGLKRTLGVWYGLFDLCASYYKEDFDFTKDDRFFYIPEYLKEYRAFCFDDYDLKKVEDLEDREKKTFLKHLILKAMVDQA
jgi:hypothetical protein